MLGIKPASTRNLIRLKMHPDDVVQAIFDVYAEHGFEDQGQVITNVVNMASKYEPNSVLKHRISEEFRSVLKHTLSGIPVFTQRCYLEAYKDIDKEARRIIVRSSKYTFEELILWVYIQMFFVKCHSIRLVKYCVTCPAFVIYRLSK